MTLQISAFFGRKRPVEKVSRRSRRNSGLFRNLNREKKDQAVRLTVSLALAAGITVGSIATVMASTRYASVTVDGNPAQVVTIDSTDTQSILKLANVTVGPDDIVSRTDGESGEIDLTVKTGVCVTVLADGSSKSVQMHFGDTVADALAEAGVNLSSLDVVSSAKTAKVTDGMKISVTRRCHVNIEADGKTIAMIAREGTVLDALTQAGIQLGTDDTTSVNKTDPVSEGMTVRVGRITYRDVTTTEAIAYSTVTKKDSSLNACTKRVTTKGQNGTKTIVTRQKLLDGNVLESSVVKTEVTKQPVNEVVTVGTKSLGRAYASVRSDGTLVDQNGKTVSYRKLYTGQCTAYHCGTRTSTGQRVRYGLVAVNPKIIPYGSKLYICSPNGKVVYGYATAADTGGAAMSGQIVADLYFPSDSQCANFGRRTMNVYVLS